MPKFILRLIVSVAAVSLMLQPAYAAKVQSVPLGNDISYPQCGKKLPSGQAFGIVGVNGGLATTTNSCLNTELLWAGKSLGDTVQSKTQLYINTANPGGLNTASWPQNNIDPTGTSTSNPYGTCDGSNSLSCSFQYGWNRAVEDVQNRFIPAARSAGVSTNPSDFPWWLDIETTNTWESGSTLSLQNNVADIEGMVSYFQTTGTTVGIYSTALQWNQIVGTIDSGSKLNGLNNWLPGATGIAGARSKCSSTPLTSNGKVILTQYTSGTLDYDYSCI